MNSRKEILKKLLLYDDSLDSVLQELSQFGWDSEGPLIELKREHIATVIGKFLNNEIGKKELNKWADAIEMRDDIEYEKKHEQLIAQVLNELSSPEINNPLKREYLVDTLATLILR